MRCFAAGGTISLFAVHAHMAGDLINVHFLPCILYAVVTMFVIVCMLILGFFLSRYCLLHRQSVCISSYWLV